MKKLLIFFALLLAIYHPLTFSQQIFPQKFNLQRDFNIRHNYIDSIIVKNESGGTDKWTVEYRNDLIFQYISYHYSDSWQPVSRTTLEYDSKNRLSTKLFENIFNNSWFPVTIDTLFYDSLNNKSKDITYVSSQNNWVRSSLIKYEYNQKNKISSQELALWNNSWWEPVKKDSFFYKDNSYLDYWFSCIKTNGIWNYYRKVEFTYRDTAHYEYAVMKNWSGEIWQNLYRINFSYDSYNNITEYLWQIPQDTSWSIDGRESYTFNQDNYALSGLFERFGNNTWYEADGLISFNNPDGFYIGFNGFSRYNIYYRLTPVRDDNARHISDYSLGNYPNPFNPSTNINYSIKEKGLVSLKVYDVLGREVSELVNEEKEAGNYKAMFNGENLSSGIYITVLKVNNYTASHKILLMK